MARRRTAPPKTSFGETGFEFLGELDLMGPAQELAKLIAEDRWDEIDATEALAVLREQLAGSPERKRLLAEVLDGLRPDDAFLDWVRKNTDHRLATMVLEMAPKAEQAAHAERQRSSWKRRERVAKRKEAIWERAWGSLDEERSMRSARRQVAALVKEPKSAWERAARRAWERASDTDPTGRDVFVEYLMAKRSNWERAVGRAEKAAAQKEGAEKEEAKKKLGELLWLPQLRPEKFPATREAAAKIYDQFAKMNRKRLAVDLGLSVRGSRQERRKKKEPRRLVGRGRRGKPTSP